MISWFAGFVVALGSTLVFLYLVGRRNEEAVLRDWDLVLTPKGHRIYSGFESRLKNELALAEVTYEEAVSLRQVGSLDEAIRLIDLGYGVIARFAPDLLRLLRAMAVFSRMVSAMAPVAPLRPRDFHLSQLSSLAYLSRALHGFLVTQGERFRLKVYIIGHGIGIAMRFLLQSTQRIVLRHPDAEREWNQIEAIQKDFQTLTAESLEGLHVLLTSLAAERREEALLEGRDVL